MTPSATLTLAAELGRLWLAIEAKNCGTGAGGFGHGNTCAGPGHGLSMTPGAIRRRAKRGNRAHQHPGKIRHKEHAAALTHQHAERVQHALEIRTERRGTRAAQSRARRTESRKHARQAAALEKRHGRETTQLIDKHTAQIARAKDPKAVAEHHSEQYAELQARHREQREDQAAEHKRERRDTRAEHREERQSKREDHLNSITELRATQRTHLAEVHNEKRSQDAYDRDVASDQGAKPPASDHGRAPYKHAGTDFPHTDHLGKGGKIEIAHETFNSHQLNALHDSVVEHGKTLKQPWSLEVATPKSPAEHRASAKAEGAGRFLVRRTQEPIHKVATEGDKTVHKLAGDVVATTHPSGPEHAQLHPEGPGFISRQENDRAPQGFDEFKHKTRAAAEKDSRAWVKHSAAEQTGKETHSPKDIDEFFQEQAEENRTRAHPDVAVKYRMIVSDQAHTPHSERNTPVAAAATATAAASAPATPVKPAAPAIEHSKAKVTYGDRDYEPHEQAAVKQAVQKLGKKIFGRNVEDHEWATLAGAPDHARVEIQQGSLPGTVTLNWRSPEAHAHRVISKSMSRDDAKPTIENHTFEVNEDQQGKGIGRKAFAMQVEAARAMGAGKFSTYAAGAPGTKLNGYSTWPKMGYDGPLPEKITTKLPGEFQDARRVSDLMTTPERRDWWAKNGESIHLEFDLAHDSLSSRIWAGYRKGTKP